MQATFIIIYWISELKNDLDSTEIAKDARKNEALNCLPIVSIFSFQLTIPIIFWKFDLVSAHKRVLKMRKQKEKPCFASKFVCLSIWKKWLFFVRKFANFSFLFFCPSENWTAKNCSLNLENTNKGRRRSPGLAFTILLHFTYGIAEKADVFSRFFSLWKSLPSFLLTFQSSSAERKPGHSVH